MGHVQGQETSLSWLHFGTDIVDYSVLFYVLCPITLDRTGSMCGAKILSMELETFNSGASESG